MPFAYEYKPLNFNDPTSKGEEMEMRRGYIWELLSSAELFIYICTNCAPIGLYPWYTHIRMPISIRWQNTIPSAHIWTILSLTWLTDTQDDISIVIVHDETR